MFKKLRYTFPVALVALIACYFGFVGMAFAAGPLTQDDQSLFELAKPVIEAIKNGNAWLAAAAGVIFSLAMARRYVPKESKPGKFINSDVGGMLSAFIFAFSGCIATAAASFATGGAGMSGAVAFAGLKVGMAAIGGFVALHKLATALTATKWWNEKAPAWLKTALAFVLALVGSSAVEKAEKAGDEAVKANPAPGSGEFTDVA